MHTARVHTKVYAAILVAACVAQACASDEGGVEVSSAGPQQQETVEDALPRLRDMVDAAADVIAAGFEVQPDEGSVPVACEDRFGNFDGAMTAPYGVQFALFEGTNISELFVTARTFWSQSGYRVLGDDLTELSVPRLYAEREGYEFQLLVVPDRRMAYLGGGTPCLPEARDGQF